MDELPATSGQSALAHPSLGSSRDISNFCKWIAALSSALFLAGCGTFPLGNVHPQSGKTAEQQQLDTLTCKDQANLAVNSAGRQTEDFLLGLTVVGAPVAYERDKDKEREVFTDCMHARGYVVTAPGQANPPSDALVKGPPQAPNPIAANPVATVPGIERLAFAPPTGFAMQALTDTRKAQGVVFFAMNRTADVGCMVIAVDHNGISDLGTYAMTRRASQADRLKDSSFTDVISISIGGRAAFRYTVTGSVNGVRVTYVTNIVEGHDQIIIENGWSGATNAIQQRALLENLADNISGIS